MDARPDPALWSASASPVGAEGGVRLGIGLTSRGSAALTIAERGGFCVRFPKVPGTCEGVLINTGGGLTGGDRLSLDVSVGPGAEAVLTTQAAEKLYRSDGSDTEIGIRLALGEGSRLDWLPQEQILFDGARLSRRLDILLGSSASLTLCESTVFGRIAKGEVLEGGRFHDRWRIRRDGRLAFADNIRLEGQIERILSRPAVAAGAKAIATVLYVGPDAERRREEARDALAEAASECGVSAWDGMLITRFLAADPQALRSDLVRFLEALRGLRMPRSWQA